MALNGTFLAATGTVVWFFKFATLNGMLYRIASAELVRMQLSHFPLHFGAAFKMTSAIFSSRSPP
jgi:hypothetical protein